MSTGQFHKLLSPLPLGSGLTLKNRMIKAPQSSWFFEDDGSAGDRVIDFYEAIAAGGVGLVIVSAITWRSDHPAGAYGALHDDRFLPGMKRLVERCHAHGCPVFCQLHHSGASAMTGHGGGLPIGAVLMNKKVADHMKPGSHGSTFGGNPVCCAGALAVLDEMDDDFLANVNERAAQLRAGLAKLPHVREVSGLGLMVGIAFDDGIKAADVRAACEKAGLLVLTAKTRLRLLPPLILTADDVDDALATLRSVLEKCV